MLCLFLKFSLASNQLVLQSDRIKLQTESANNGPSSAFGDPRRVRNAENQFIGVYAENHRGYQSRTKATVSSCSPRRWSLSPPQDDRLTGEEADYMLHCEGYKLEMHTHVHVHICRNRN